MPTTIVIAVESSLLGLDEGGRARPSDAYEVFLRRPKAKPNRKGRRKGRFRGGIVHRLSTTYLQVIAPEDCEYSVPPEWHSPLVSPVSF